MRSAAIAREAAAADRDGDGFLSWGEFCAWYRTFQADLATQKRKAWQASGAQAPPSRPSSPSAPAVQRQGAAAEHERTEPLGEQAAGHQEPLAGAGRRDSELDEVEQEMLRVFTAFATFGRGAQAGESPLQHGQLSTGH